MTGMQLDLFVPIILALNEITLKASMSKKIILWITDPWETLDHENDTTLRLAQEYDLKGVKNFWCDVRTLRWANKQAWLDSYEMTFDGFKLSKDNIHLKNHKLCKPSEFKYLMYRVDPPVDLSYIQPLQMLWLSLKLNKSKSKLINPAASLIMANEKLEGSLVGNLMPDSLVTSLWERMVEFGVQHKLTVLKPLNMAQSRGVELLKWNSKQEIIRSKALIKKATNSFRNPILLQEFLKEISKGETRLWFVDGVCIATVKKFPLKNDFRVDIDKGSVIKPHQLSNIEKKIAKCIGKKLKELNVRLAAIDLISDKVTDYNVISPGLIPQMERVLNKNLAKEIIKIFS